MKYAVLLLLLFIDLILKFAAFLTKPYGASNIGAIENEIFVVFGIALDAFINRANWMMLAYLWLAVVWETPTSLESLTIWNAQALICKQYSCVMEGTMKLIHYIRMALKAHFYLTLTRFISNCLVFNHSANSIILLIGIMVPLETDKLLWISFRIAYFVYIYFQRRIVNWAKNQISLIYVLLLMITINLFFYNIGLLNLWFHSFYRQNLCFKL